MATNEKKDMDKRIKEIMDYLKAKDLDSLEVGTYKESDDWYYIVQAYNTKAVEDCRLETHKKYVDIQWVLKGEERLDIVSPEGLEVEEAYDEEKDAAFWKAPECMMQMVLTDGGYAVLYPENAHRPGRAVDAPSPVRKIVVKVKL